MELDLKQVSPSRRSYAYKISLGPDQEYEATAPRRHIPWLRPVRILDTTGDTVLVMRQPNVWWPLMERIVFVLPCPYLVYRNGQLVGRFKVHFHFGFQGRIVGRWRDKRITVYEHMRNAYSVWSEGAQIGLVQHDAFRPELADSYRVRFDYDQDPMMMVALTLFLDLAWFTEDNEYLSGEGYHYSLSLGGKKLDPDWTPKEAPR